MYRDKTVAVVVPAYNEEVLIRTVIETMPAFVDKIIIVNDKSTDNTAVVVREYVSRDPDRVVLVDLEENQGVGGAIAEGYKVARDNQIDCTAVMAGDAQMDPGDLPKLLDPRPYFADLPDPRGETAYSTQIGRPFHGKVDGRSMAKWTVGATRHAGPELFTLGWIPPSMEAGICAGTRRSERADGRGGSGD